MDDSKKSACVCVTAVWKAIIITCCAVALVTGGFLLLARSTDGRHTVRGISRKQRSDKSQSHPPNRTQVFPVSAALLWPTTMVVVVLRA